MNDADSRVPESTTTPPAPEPSAKPQETKTRKKPDNLTLKLLTLIAFLGMVTVNALANLLPIAGRNTGDVSDSFPDLFAPAGLTFSIWGLIYILLAVFTILQFFRPASEEATGRIKYIQVLFIISSLANIGWIFAWHHLYPGVSLILIVAMLLCLILIDRKVSRQSLSFREKIGLYLPFSVYFGWITVATVANVTAFLVSIEWDGLGIADSLWTVIVLIVTTIIGLIVITSRMNWAFGAVIVWALAGILIRHLDAVDGFGGEYIHVIVTVSICIGLCAAASLLALFGRSIKLSKNQA